MRLSLANRQQNFLNGSGALLELDGILEQSLDYLHQALNIHLILFRLWYRILSAQLHQDLKEEVLKTQAHKDLFVLGIQKQQIFQLIEQLYLNLRL